MSNIDLTTKKIEPIDLHMAAKKTIDERVDEAARARYAEEYCRKMVGNLADEQLPHAQRQLLNIRARVIGIDFSQFRSEMVLRSKKIGWLNAVRKENGGDNLSPAQTEEIIELYAQEYVYRNLIGYLTSHLLQPSYVSLDPEMESQLLMEAGLQLTTKTIETTLCVKPFYKGI